MEDLMRAAIAACLILAACHTEENLGNTPTRTILASSNGSQEMMGLALDANYLYWTSLELDTPQLGFWRVPRRGGDVEKLAQLPVSREDPEPGFVIDDSYIYISVFMTEHALSFIRVPKTGGAVQILDDTTTSNDPVASDGDFLYTSFVDDNVEDGIKSQLRAYPVSGGPPAVIIDPFEANSAVVAHDKLLYFVDGTGALVSVPRIGGSPTEIGLGFNYAELVASNDDLYILQHPSSNDGFAPCNGWISAMAFTEGTLYTVETDFCANQMAVTANAIFTVQEGTKIVAFNLDGSGEREVLTEQGGPQFFVGDAADATLFYNLGDEIIALDFN
jgi:hypothetical protein